MIWIYREPLNSCVFELEFDAVSIYLIHDISKREEVHYDQTSTRQRRKTARKRRFRLRRRTVRWSSPRRRPWRAARPRLRPRRSALCIAAADRRKALPRLRADQSDRGKVRRNVQP